MKRKLITWYIYLRKQLWRWKKRTSIQGQYCAYYILDKYFLKTKSDDYMEAYEKVIDLTMELMLKVKIFEQCEVLPNREDAAFFTLVRLTFFARKDMREAIYEYGKNWEGIPIVKAYIKKGFVL